MGNPQDFLAIRTKVDITSAQECSQFMEGNRSELSVAMGADRCDIIFFDKLDHFFLLILYTIILLKIFCKKTQGRN